MSQPTRPYRYYRVTIRTDNEPPRWYLGHTSRRPERLVEYFTERHAADRPSWWVYDVAVEDLGVTEPAVLMDGEVRLEYDDPREW